ncbi:hypothetical protein [Candidatus Desulforudis audaxviator]|uniref:Uncharacterized protein n=1 Tax=Desulforudis audaxviator (strain MP104C) TaxID=477974 RepID=B1I1I0_DESAP|nr:hypothetical protein [Candidatus Desulforudis audaxviator]ACA58576.1 hypothetical protein Daud_0007 [Candidatus Desulforudis audaxviator MP104C]
MMEISLKKLSAFLVLAFVAGILLERWLALSEPVVRVVSPVTSWFGPPFLWLVAGVLAGVGGMMFLRRLREASSLDAVRGSRFKRNGDRF